MREAEEQRQLKTAKRQSAEIRRLSTLADAMRGQTAKRARVAHTLDRRVARIETERVQAPKRRRALQLRFPTPPHAARTVLTATALWKVFGAKDVFSDLSFDVGRGERLLVMGFNGAGKTTLLKVLAGRLDAELGEVALGQQRVAWLLRGGTRGDRLGRDAARAHG